MVITGKSLRLLNVKDTLFTRWPRHVQVVVSSISDEDARLILTLVTRSPRKCEITT